jgi:S-DNA-T family DNA segregation ATPase FtsK/SpoIIIE
VRDVLDIAAVTGTPWVLPLGIGERDLGPVGLVLHEGEHALVAGPARSGRSTALRVLAAGACVDRDALVVAIAPPRSPLLGEGDVARAVRPDELVEAIAAVVAHDGPALLLVDDAEQLDDRDGALAALVTGAPPHVHVVAAGRSEVLRTAFQHWTRPIRRSRAGLLLAPNPDLDGELLGHVLPRRAPVPLGPGRGWLVDGADLVVIQVANPGLDNA